MGLVCVECVGETGRDGPGHSSTRRLVFAPIISKARSRWPFQRPSHGLCGWDPWLHAESDLTLLVGSQMTLAATGGVQSSAFLVNTVGVMVKHPN
jgi:hypothetical protein